MFSIQMLRLDVIKIVFQYVFESCLKIDAQSLWTVEVKNLYYC